MASRRRDVGRRAAPVDRLVDLRSGQQLSLQLPARDDAVGAGRRRTRRWFDFLQTQKFGPLVDYYAALPGGGSREGTGYGTAQKNLFENYIYWKASTGENLAGITPHTRETIDYWVHATVPTRDRFAPIGDQSRSSIPELYDYHENLVHAAVVLSAGHAPGAARHLVAAEQLGQRRRAQLQPRRRPAAVCPTRREAPTELVYHARRRGRAVRAHRAGRTDAAWLSFIAGKYDQSHAHQDQGRSRSSRTTGWP